MATPVTCRYCGEQFIPKRGKPGFVDECQECLYAKTVPQIPEEQRILARLMTGKVMRGLRRQFIKIKMDEAQADAAILKVFELAEAAEKAEAKRKAGEGPTQPTE